MSVSSSQVDEEEEHENWRRAHGLCLHHGLANFKMSQARSTFSLSPNNKCKEPVLLLLFCLKVADVLTNMMGSLH